MLSTVQTQQSNNNNVQQPTSKHVNCHWDSHILHIYCAMASLLALRVRSRVSTRKRIVCPKNTQSTVLCCFASLCDCDTNPNCTQQITIFTYSCISVCIHMTQRKRSQITFHRHEIITTMWFKSYETNTRTSRPRCIEVK